VGAGLVLSQMAGVHTSSGLKVTYIILAAAIQAVMPYLGHATMVKVLRALIVPSARSSCCCVLRLQARVRELQGIRWWLELFSAVWPSPSHSPVSAGRSAATTIPATCPRREQGSIVGWMFLARRFLRFS